MARTPAWMRLMLLAVLAFGVAGMHTFGHQSLAVAGSTMPPHTSAHGTAAAAEARGALSGTADTPGRPHHPVSPLSVCLAILSLAILAVLALIAAFGTTVTMQRLTHRLATVPRRAGRTPPPPPRHTGLTLATVSVMRL